MPQMAPLNWLTLMTMFIVILLMFNSVNYYIFSYKNKETKTQNKKTKINWKW